MKEKMKRFIAVILGVLFLSVVLCACSSNSDKNTVCEHQYGDWIVVAKPTYLAIGQEKATCDLCGEYKYRDIPMLEPVSVQLDKNNFLDYFAIDCYVGEYEESKGKIFTYGYATIDVKCSLKADGDLNDVSVKLALYSNDGIWYGQNYDPISMSIAATTGMGETSQVISACSTDSLEVKQPGTVDFEILEVNGSIVVYP